MREWVGSDPERHKPGSGFGLVLIVLVGAVGVTYLASGSLRGAVAAMLWSEEEMLTCDGELSMTLEGRVVELADPVIDVGGLCELRLIDCTLTGPTAMQVGGNSRVYIERSRLYGTRTALRVSGTAEVTIVSSELFGEKAAIEAGNSARVRVSGGEVQGMQAALRVSGSAEVKGEAVAASGAYLTEQHGRVAGFPEGAPAPAEVAPEPAGEAEAAGEGVHGAPIADERAAELLARARRIAEVGIRKEAEEAALAEVAAVEAATESGPPAEETAEQKYERYASGACSGVLRCYQESDFVGHLAGKIVMKVNARGRVVSVKPRLKGASKRIRACVKRACKKRLIADFDGPPGNLICTFAGTLGGGSVMIDRSGAFVPEKKRRRGGRTRRAR